MGFWKTYQDKLQKISMKEEDCRCLQLPFIEIICATVPFSILRPLTSQKLSTLGEQAEL